MCNTNTSHTLQLRALWSAPSTKNTIKELVAKGIEQVIKVKSRASGKQYEDDWLESEDLVSLTDAFLGHRKANQPVTWKIFLENAVRHYTGENGRLQPRENHRGFVVQAVNTALGRGLHWMCGSVVMNDDHPFVTLLEMYGKGSTISAHVWEAAKELLHKDHPPKYVRTGAQVVGDNVHCGHDTSWYQLITELALASGIDMSGWEPTSAPKGWYEVVGEVLRIRDTLEPTPYTIGDMGLATTFKEMNDNGQLSMYQLLNICKVKHTVLRAYLLATVDIEEIEAHVPVNSARADRLSRRTTRVTTSAGQGQTTTSSVAAPIGVATRTSARLSVSVHMYHNTHRGQKTTLDLKTWKLELTYVGSRELGGGSQWRRHKKVDALDTESNKYCNASRRDEAGCDKTRGEWMYRSHYTS